MSLYSDSKAFATQGSMWLADMYHWVVGEKQADPPPEPVDAATARDITRAPASIQASASKLNSIVLGVIRVIVDSLLTATPGGQNETLIQAYSTEAMNFALRQALIGGNGYILLTDSTGRDVSKWRPLSARSMNPIFGQVDGERAIVGYRSGSRVYAASEVLHLKYQLSEQNPLIGRSPLDDILVELRTDNAAALFTISMLLNSAIPGLVISPPDDEHELQPDDADDIRDKINASLTASNVGKTVVLSKPVTIEVLKHENAKFDLGEMRNVPEERIAALYGVPPILASLGTGLQHVRQNATISILRLEFVENTVLPLLLRIQEQMNEQFLDVIPNIENQPFEFDISTMPALQIAEERRIKLIIERFKVGYITDDEARRMDGLIDLQHNEESRGIAGRYYTRSAKKWIVKDLPKAEDPPAPEPELDPPIEVIPGIRSRNGSHVPVGV